MSVSMKRLSFLAVIMTVIGSCAAPKATADVTDNFHSTTEFAVWDNCHGEYVWIQTEYHGVVKVRVKKDGSTTYDFHVNAHGTAVGLDSGTQYVFNDSYTTSDSFTSTTFASSLNWRTRLISPGSSDNITIITKFAYRFDGTDFFIDVDSVETECHG